MLFPHQTLWKDHESSLEIGMNKGVESREPASSSVAHWAASNEFREKKGKKENYKNQNCAARLLEISS